MNKIQESSPRFTDAPLRNLDKLVLGWKTISKEDAIEQGSGLGFVKAVIQLLLIENGNINAINREWQIKIPSSSSKKIYQLSGNNNSWRVIEAKSYLIVIGAILDALVVSFDEKVIKTWEHFLEQLEMFLVAEPPFTLNQLTLASQQEHLNYCLLKLCREVRSFLYKRVKEVEIINQPYLDRIPENKQFYSLLNSFQPSKVTNKPLVKTLSRVVKRGGTALLIGPTGVGKTESVKASALNADAILVKIAGHPGLDNRALFGGTYPDGKGSFTFIDGPLTEAWKYAANGQKVILLIDELARMDSYYHSIIIGALDSLSAAEITARPRFFLSNNLPCLNTADRYYPLMLPNGEALIAPVKNLSLIATTNLGTNYQQLTAELDPALMRRFQVHLDVQRLDKDSRIKILKNTQIPLRLAQLMVDIEEFSHSQTAVHGGLLGQPANISILLNWANEAIALTEEENCTWQQAIVEGSKITIIPFVCPRNSDGTLEKPSIKIILDEIERLCRQFKIN